MDWMDEVQEVIDEALVAASDLRVDRVTLHLHLIRYIERIERIMQGGRNRSLLPPR